MKRMVYRAAVGAALVGCWTGIAEAQTLEAESFAGARVRIDGMLREWQVRGATLSETVRGTAPEGSVRIAYDANALYVAAQVKDDQIHRTARASDAEDHLALSIAFPESGAGYTVQRLTLFPGDPGRLPGVVKLDGRALSQVDIVEAPTADGYILEAKIPWSALPAARQVRVGLRATAQVVDADGGTVRGIGATSRATSADAMPPLLMPSELGLRDALRRVEARIESPTAAATGNVAGDAQLERVALYGGVLTIIGGGYRRGSEFFYGDQNVPDGSYLRNLRLADLDGDGHDEILLEKRVGGGAAHRWHLEVLKVGEDDAPRMIFSHETAIITADGSVENEWSVTRAGGKPAIVVSQGDASGFRSGSFREPMQTDMPSVLLPWETVGSRTYQWEDQGFAKVAETTSEPRLTGGGPASSGSASRSAPAVQAPPPPRPPTSGEMLNQVYELFRRERGGAGEPAFDFVTDVAVDSEVERVLVHGLDVVVFGRNFRDGQSYVYTTLAFASADDLTAVDARDLTGDGKAEILVRGVVRANAGEASHPVTVERHLFLVYEATESGLKRSFAAETGRAIESERVISSVRFLPDSSIELVPGIAVGWTSGTYPFAKDEGPRDGVYPPALPWGGQSQRFVFRGGEFVPQ